MRNENLKNLKNTHIIIFTPGKDFVPVPRAASSALSGFHAAARSGHEQNHFDHCGAAPLGPSTNKCEACASGKRPGRVGGTSGSETAMKKKRKRETKATAMRVAG